MCVAIIQPGQDKTGEPAFQLQEGRGCVPEMDLKKYSALQRFSIWVSKKRWGSNLAPRFNTGDVRDIYVCIYTYILIFMYFTPLQCEKA